VLRTFDGVTVFLAISQFVRDKHVEGGLPPARIRVKPHFAWPSPRRHDAGDYFLYVGRLSVEKGVGTLLEAWRSVANRLLIVGDGPDASRIQAEAPPNVTLLPPVPAREVPRLLARARAVMVPSVCYEGAGRVVLEAYAAGVPVLGSRIGALPEVIEDGLSGRLLTPGASDEWAAAAAELADDATSEQLGAGAFRLWNERYGPTQAICHLEQAYAAALDGLVLS
jgi:glycosyltransferase involved in cell wall biosynthesis